ncbi:hypothetical protein WMY93_006351 [Mugilogobius chulae]|uniref:Ig-like domain-containing protein n=1 Tax=Mugilogobius chulae TaxID=88201 RepID=A0AAW0PNH9_9GOBI
MLFGTMETKLWIIILLSSLQLFVRLSASTPSSSPPVPTLSLFSRYTDSAVLVCRIPGGHKGVQFVLYRVREKVDSRDVPLGAEEVHFTVRLSDPSQHELYCCLYKTEDGYSTFSPYLQLDRQRDAGPSRPTQSYPDPPVLSVEPSNGLVKRGDTLLFHCSLPPPLPQYQANSYNRPVSFLLLRGAAADSKGLTPVAPQAQSSPLSGPEPQPGVFNVGPVTGAEQGQYTCIYQLSRGGALQNSTVSNMIQVTVTDLLPTPSLILQQKSDVWHLLCRGSPAYPGAVFLFTCRTVLHLWKSSGVDWPLILGSLSAAVLFLCSLALIILVLHRKMKAAAEAKRKREEAQFWTHVHGKDHVVDLTLQRSSFTSQDWTSSNTESASRAQLWNPLSTFTTIVQNY